jgi:hypothetical protein
VYRSNVMGFLPTIGPELVDATLPGDWGPEQIYAHSGNTAVRYSGSSVGEGRAFCCMVAFSVSIPIDSQTKMLYWILPQQDNGRYVGVDLHCSDGTSLTNIGSTDTNGIPMSPGAGHGGNIPLYQWSAVKCDLGKWIAGKTVDTVWITYARDAAHGQFRGYIDDLVIADEPVSTPH